MTGGRHSAALLSGDRLHLHHGPIDLVIGWDGPGRSSAFRRAEVRFATILDELVPELPRLRRPVCTGFEGPVAQRMARATAPHQATFVTPMAAVAGAVADEVLGAMRPGPDVGKAYVNNGGDIACHITGNARLTVMGATGPITLTGTERVRGVATSGWRGRSLSLGIADAVTVLARDAARADVAATLIANSVDLPKHPAIQRRPATEIAPDSDLGERPATVSVGPLTLADVRTALAAGARVARHMRDGGLIDGVSLTLNGETLVLNHETDLMEGHS